MDYTNLKNAYFAMRHGQSLANREAIIVSDPSIGTSGYGLSSLGRQQALDSARKFMKDYPSAQRAKIFSSDFLRAWQTAQLLAETLQSSTPPQTVVALRERFFGDFDGQNDRNYQVVWAADEQDATHRQRNVESVESVRLRTAALLAQLEKQYCNQLLILVAHGDVLQIMQTWFAGIPGEHHRRIPHLEVAEIRALNSAQID